jgi:transcriptional regulator with GAF, ATPase, and Fis domain
LTIDSPDQTLIRHRGGELLFVRHRLTVRVVDGETDSHERTLDGAQFLIGSAPDADLVLGDPLVSRRHCEIGVTGDHYVVRDLESTNGTFLGGVRVTEAPLAPGATLRVGDTTLLFEPRQKWVRLERPGSSFGQLVGSSPSMQKLLAILERIAGTRLSTVLVGETGTGKELAARALHEASDRRAGPFVVVDCGAASDALFQSELFGHEKGAFTGADRARPGAFELASGGSVFLDEIGELPLELQPRLLRALERREVRRLGASHPIEVDVRVICATHRPLQELSESGQFRRDLYYRLAEVLLELPPLRDRLVDVPVIAQGILDRERPGQGYSLRPDAIEALQAQSWPGNVRELRNVLRRTLELCASRSISATDLGLVSRPQPRRVAAPPEVPIDASAGELTLERARAEHNLEFERRYLGALLERFAWDFDRAAAAASVHVKTLKRMARKHGIAAGRGVLRRRADD